MVRETPRGPDTWEGDESAAERCTRRAYLELEAKRPERSLAVLRECDAGQGPVVQSIQAVAQGMIACGAGAVHEAAGHFERARLLGVPLLALLRERAHYHRQLSQFDAAFECSTLMDALQPGAVIDLLRDVPDPMVLRLSPWVMAGARAEGPAADGFERVRSAMVRAWGEAGTAMVLSQLAFPAPAPIAAFSGLDQAYRAYRAGDHQAALRIAEAEPDCRNAVGKAIACAAQAVLARTNGKQDEEHRLMDEAFACRVPLPELLRACGRHFKHDRGDYARAYECYAALDQVEPDDFIEYSRGLPSHWRCRHAPATMTRMLHGARPSVYHLLPTKAALAQLYGSWAAGAMLAQSLKADRWRLRRLKLRSVEGYAREHALAYDELIPPGEVKVSVPAAWGRPRLASVHGRSRSVFHCVLEDIVVTSKSNLLRARDAMLLDFQGDELARIPVNFAINPEVVSGNEAELAVLELGGDASEPVLDAAFSLVGLNTSNFGHWVFEFMFQLWMLMRRPAFESLTLIIDRQMPPQLREMLEFFTDRRNPVMVLGPGESVRVRQLWACSKISYWPGGEQPSGAVLDFELSDTDALARLIATLQPQLQAVARDGYPEHIYLTRGEDQSRPLTNRPDVEDLFRARGFAVLNFNDMPFIEQVRHLRAARTVILEAGSAIYGLLMCRPGTRIGEITYENPTDYEWCSEMFNSLGLDLLLFPCISEETGPDVAGALQLTVELTKLGRFIDDRLGIPG